MTVVQPVHVSASTAEKGRDRRHGRWAVGLAAVFGAAFAATIVTIALAYALGARGAIDDTWLGMLLGAVDFVALVGSVATFVLAIVAVVRGARWVWLWLPLSLFPACVLFLLLGEALWWE